MDDTRNEIMNAEQAAEALKQEDVVDPASNLDPSAEGTFACGTSDGADEIAQIGVGADIGEEDVKMEYVDSTVEESEAVFRDTKQVELNQGDVSAIKTVQESFTEEPISMEEGRDSKPASGEIKDVDRARDDLQEEQPKRKRIRRVGMTPVREIPKTEEGPESHDPTANGDIPTHLMTPTEDVTEGTEGTGGEIMQEEGSKEEAKDGESENKETGVSELSGVDESKPADEKTIAEAANPAVDPTLNTPIPGTYADGVYISSTGTRVLSKHDEKWRNMFEKLVEYIKQNGNTAVPQCYHDDPQLGRWVHYQRVEYWIYQQTGSGKISDARINRLNSIGFEWNPQQAQWEKMFTKLKQFKEEIGHCRVPKGYSKDPELANWVRNQRLEQANYEKQKKSRMTPDRFKLLDEMGFKWSSPTPSRSRKNTKIGEEDEGQEHGIKSEENAEEKEGVALEEAVATAAAAAAAAAVAADAKEGPTALAAEGAEDSEAKEDEQEEIQMQDSVKDANQVPSMQKAEAAIEV